LSRGWDYGSVRIGLKENRKQVNVVGGTTSVWAMVLQTYCDILAMSRYNRS